MRRTKVAITFGVIVGSLFTSILWLPNGPDRYSLIGLLITAILVTTFWEELTFKRMGEDDDK